MKKELYLDVAVGFMVGMLVGLAIIVFSKVGFSLGTGGVYDTALDRMLLEIIPYNLNWAEILKFTTLFGIFFAILNPMYTYSKKGLRKQLALNRQHKVKK